MKRFAISVNDGLDEHTPDAKRIADVLTRAGYVCDVDQARRLWTMVAIETCEAWPCLPCDDKDVVDRVLYYFDVVGVIDATA